MTGGRVLLVVGPATGGMGAHVASLATGLPALGWAVDVATARSTAERFGLTAAICLWPQQGAAGAPSGYLASAQWLRRLAAGHDVVHAHGHQAGLLAALVTRSLPPGRRPALIVSWHNALLVTGARRRLLTGAESIQVRAADLVTGASADLVARARGLGAREAELAPVAAPAAGPWPGDRAAQRRALLADLGAAAGTRLVLTVSRVAPQKDLSTLVESALVLQARGVDAVWLVAGDGDGALLARLQQRVAELRVPVHFLGARGDVPRLLALADVLALPSTWEARALAVQEAMAAGLPVVVTAVGGLPELVGEAGILVPAADPGALADAVGRVLADPELAARLADAGRRRFAELPTPGQVTGAWASRYGSVLSGGGDVGSSH